MAYVLDILGLVKFVDRMKAGRDRVDAIDDGIGDRFTSKEEFLKRMSWVREVYIPSIC